MAKLYFSYGVMGSGKSTELLQVKHNYESYGGTVIVLTPSIDDRYGVGKVTSRLGVYCDSIAIKSFLDIVGIKIKILQGEYKPVVILVDEAQFFDRDSIDSLADIVDTLDIPVMCYGLRADINNDLFEGSQRLFELADSLKEIKTVCKCGRKAIKNNRHGDNKESIVIGGDDLYYVTCRKCGTGYQ